VGILRFWIQQLKKEIETLTAEAAPKEVVYYTEKLTVLQYALEQYTNRDEGQDVPESVIEAFVVKIVVSKDGFDWYLRFDGDPDKPLHCQLQGKRKSSTKILVSPGCSPSMDSSPTGCYQGWQELSDYRKFATLVVTLEDAQAFMYRLSRKRRVHKWRDIRVNLYI